MLIAPEINKGPTQCRMLSFDPGTRTLGIAMTVLDLVAETITVVEAGTLDVVREGRATPWYEDIHGDRENRLYAVESKVESLVRRWSPEVIIAEAPYMGRGKFAFVDTYNRLVRCVGSIIQGVKNVTLDIPVVIIEASVVKKYLGVPGNSGDKLLVQRAVLKQTNVVFDSAVTLEGLDEHAFDAIAIAYYKAQQYFDYRRSCGGYPGFAKSRR